MATVDITLGTAQTKGGNGGTLPVIDAVYIDTDLITSSSSSQQSDFAVPANGFGLVWRIAVTGGNIRAKFGDNPTAVAAEDGGWLLLDGHSYDFGASANQKVAIITA